jgi:hypothetical protein
MLVSTILALAAVSFIVSFLFSYVIVQNVDGEFLRIFKPSNNGQVEDSDAKINMTNAPRDTIVMNQTIQPQGEISGRFVNPESGMEVNASTPPTAPGSADDKLKLFIELLAGSNPGFRGADQAIYVNVLDYSSRTGIAQAKIAGVMVGGSGAADFIKNANSTKLLDVGQIEGQKFTGITDTNGQFSYTTRINEDFEPGPIALIITVESDGYEPLSKIATFDLE